MKLFNDFYASSTLGAYVLEEGAKDKIAKYKITDPYLIFFTFKYEPHLDWTKVTDLNSLNEQISMLVKELFKRTFISNKENSLYMKDINLEIEFQYHMNDPQIQQAWQVYRQQPDEAKAIVLKTINDEKKDAFEQWINYFTKENEIYKKTPAFQYIMMKPVFDESDEKTKAACAPVDADAIGSIYEKISEAGGKDQFNIMKMYKKTMNENQMKSSSFQRTGEADGWLRIPGKPCDPEHFNANVRRLKSISVGRGWCTASGLAEPYLCKGDFWFYIESGIAVVAIRLTGGKADEPSTNIGEIRGKDNNDQMLYSYVDIVVPFIKEKKFTGGTSFIDLLKTAKETNEKFIADPEFRAKLMPAIVRSDNYNLNNEASQISIGTLRRVKDDIRKPVMDQLKDCIKSPTGSYYDDRSELIVTNVFKDDDEMTNIWLDAIFARKKANLKDIYHLSYVDLVRELTKVPEFLHAKPTFNEKVSDYYNYYLKRLQTCMVDIMTGQNYRITNNQDRELAVQQVKELMKATSPNFTLLLNNEELNKKKVETIKLSMEVTGDPEVLDYIPRAVQSALNVTADMFKGIDFTKAYKILLDTFEQGTPLGGFLKRFSSIPVFISDTVLKDPIVIGKLRNIIMDTFKNAYREAMKARGEKDVPKPTWRNIKRQDRSYSDVWNEYAPIQDIMDVCLIPNDVYNGLPDVIKKDQRIIHPMRQTYLALYAASQGRVEYMFTQLETHLMKNDYNSEMPADGLLYEFPKIALSQGLVRQIRANSRRFLNKYSMITDTTKIRTALNLLDIGIGDNEFNGMLKSSAVYVLSNFPPQSTRGMVNLITRTGVPEDLKDDPEVKTAIKAAIFKIAEKDPAAVKKWTLRRVLKTRDFSKEEFEKLMSGAQETSDYPERRMKWLETLLSIFHYPRKSSVVRTNYRYEDVDQNARTFQIHNLLRYANRYYQIPYDVVKHDEDFVYKAGLIFDTHYLKAVVYGWQGDRSQAAWMNDMFTKVLEKIRAVNPQAIQLNTAYAPLVNPLSEEEKEKQKKAEELAAKGAVKKQKVQPKEPEYTPVIEPMSLKAYRAAIAGEPESEEEIPEEESVNRFDSIIKSLVK